MKEFFSKKQVQLSERSAQGIHSCASCGLYQNALNPRMGPHGEGKKGIFILGEHPGEAEDKAGVPWRDAAGRLLRRTYKKLGVDLDKDCTSMYAVHCRPVDQSGKEKAITSFEVACCRRKVFQAIKRLEPKVIILHGSQAMTSILGHRWKEGVKDPTNRWRGWAIPDRELNAWICPTFPPFFVNWQEEANEIGVLWEKDLKTAFSLIDTPIPQYPPEEEQVSLLESEDEIQALLQFLITKEYPEPKMLAFDIETTGLKPYNLEEAKVACISFSPVGEEKAYVMPAPKSKKNLRLLKRLLTRPDIGKVAANMKFEDTWMNIIYGIEVAPWAFDTVVGAHILDNRPGITSLKFQSFVNFGLVGYEEEVKPYLQSSDGQTPNKIMEAMESPELRRKIMVYCGVDSLVTGRLALAQMEELNLL